MAVKLLCSVNMQITRTWYQYGDTNKSTKI